jgi:YidC/Oxa1 family membrane protein insertase
MWELLAAPALWVLRLLHPLLGDWGLAIVALALGAGVVGIVAGRAAKRRTQRHQDAMEALRPEIRRIQDQHADRARRQRELTDMYRRAGVNPMSGCMVALVAWLPFLLLALSVYAALRTDPELSRAGFLWLPALGDPDPHHALPAALGLHALIGWLVVVTRKLPPERPTGPIAKLAALLYVMILPIACIWLPAGLVLHEATRRIPGIAALPFLRDR